MKFSGREGLTAAGGPPLRGFAVAGTDRKFYWADAAIDGQSVVVSSPKVPAPAAVRYGWNGSLQWNLADGAGRPASPFRTDDWPLLSAKNK